MVEGDPEHRSRRFVELIEQLGDERGRKHGWKRAVADQLGIHPSYVTKLLGGAETTVREETLEDAAWRLGVSPVFFDEPSGTHYREWMLEDLLPGAGPEQRAEIREIARELVRGALSDPGQARQFSASIWRWAEQEARRYSLIRDLAKDALAADDERAGKAAAHLGAHVWAIVTRDRRT